MLYIVFISQHVDYSIYSCIVILSLNGLLMAETEKSPFGSNFEQDTAPSAKMIQQQLKCILASPNFKATEAQSAFLTFVVEKALAGQSDEIKGYTVATQVFGRREDFDQSTDPVVSIHANKLRRALERYYLTASRQDPILIDIPKGTYVPVFHRQRAIESKQASQDRRRSCPGRINRGRHCWSARFRI